jgi:hypothetical protein
VRHGIAAIYCKRKCKDGVATMERDRPAACVGAFAEGGDLKWD